MRLGFSNGSPERVIKIANRDPEAIEIERVLYPEMRSVGLPVPLVEHSHHDGSGGAPPFIIMPKFSDETLGDVRRQLDDQALGALRRAGEFISQVDTVFRARFEELRSQDSISRRLDETQERIDRPVDLELVREAEPELCELIEWQLSSAARPCLPRLTHGQPHTRNILRDHQGQICVVDFGETIGFRSPLSDLYLLLTSHDGWSRGTGDVVQRQAILDGYGELDHADWLELQYWELRSWTETLRSYIGFSRDPTKNQEFVSQQLRFIRSKIDEILNGSGLISRIQSEMSASTR